ncbi:S1C family serine protease [Streptomyces shenzhenensis]|uniref:Protease n=1 Tax=Streptomyces shenzhenensis TaxID=943815 RepID=A0A3M0IEP5_9ACTN|nr:trypsin-like peptidase domain-containing protein [Streptomyces shenzhenensis]RMB87557.1 protease [Streptomyces shenzhenensis]
MNEGKPVPPGEDVADTPTPVAGSDGDFELARPSAAATGDFALRHPTAAGAEDADAGAEAVRAAAGSRAEADGGRGAGADLGAVALGAEGAGAAPAGEAGGRGKPLHDPDPYSTPPYGEPGPWAPAPPVQHPATTPAQGTAIPAPAPPPAHDAAIPAPGAPHDVPPVTGTPQPEPDAAPYTGSDAAPYAGPDAMPYTGPDAMPYPGPDSTPYAGPDSTPYPAPDSTPHAGPDSTPYPVSHPAPYPAPEPGSHPGPWHRYDPWAAPAPLQQNGAAVPTEGQRRRRARKALIGGALALALASGGVGGVVGMYLERNGGVADVRLPQAGKETTARPADSVAGIAARALPSVVTLHVTGSSEQGTGTGFVLDTRGHILTNNHVVEPAGSNGDITVTFSGGETAKARVVGRDSGYDLAVVQVKGVHGLEPLPLGNSDNVQVGDPVVAIGAPFDLSNTVTSGIISAKERPITAGGGSGNGSDVSYVDALQTDAPINPGNSGGPLLDAQARVVGINSAIRSADGGSDTQGGQSGSIGLGFAIPVNQAKRVAEELINDGRATHPVIGITLDMAYSGDGARIGTKGGDGGPAVTTGGPGDRAGLRPGDIITEVDGQRVHSGDELIVKTRARRPGDRLSLTVERDGTEKQVSLVLGSSDHN